MIVDEGELASCIALALHRRMCDENPGHVDWMDCDNAGPCADDAVAVMDVLREFQLVQ